jgi:hypothetical protein
MSTIVIDKKPGQPIIEYNGLKADSTVTKVEHCAKSVVFQEVPMRERVFSTGFAMALDVNDADIPLPWDMVGTSDAPCFDGSV